MKKPNWLFPLARVIGAGVPFGGVLVQINAELDARVVQQRLANLEDPISALHPDVREFAALLYRLVQSSDHPTYALPEAELVRFARVIAILEKTGLVRGQYTLQSRLPLSLWLDGPQFSLYMAALYEDPDAMSGLTSHVDSAPAGTWLRGPELQRLYLVPLRVVRAVFELYAARGLGLLSDEVGTTNYLCQA
jgi:hypothetical protein